MNVLINGSPTAIGRAVVAELADSSHKLRLTSMAPYESQDVVVCALEHDEATDELVRGIDAIINVGYQDEVDMGATFHLDYYTRRTYNLFWAASNADVKRICKEFARDRMFEVVNLRLGWPLVEGGVEALQDSPEMSALCSQDLGRAVLSALSADVEQWQDIHLQSAVANQRFTTAKAAEVLGV